MLPTVLFHGKRPRGPSTRDAYLPGTNPTTTQWCAERLAAMKVPHFVLFVDELPHTPTHKVAKHVLKADPTLKSRAVDLQARP